MHKLPDEMKIAEHLMWVPYMFSTTEEVAEHLTDDLLDWRPADPTGAWQFSLAEIVMHIADARRMFCSQLSGDDPLPDYWCPSFWSGEDPRDDGSYAFRPHGGRVALLADLKAARELFKPYLTRPASEVGQSTEGTEKFNREMIEQLKAGGADPAPLERSGPSTIYQVLLMTIAHESGHRGALHTLLRINGAIPVEE